VDNAPAPSDRLPNTEFLPTFSDDAQESSNFIAGMSAPIFHDITIPPFYAPSVFSLPSDTLHGSYSGAGQPEAPSVVVLPPLGTDNQS
jgi:hypothetical protein